MTVFEHPGLLYRDPGSFLAGTVPFVRAAVSAGEPVLAALPAGRLGLLRRALGSAAGGVDFTDMTRAGRNPGRILPSVLLPFAEAHAGRPVAIVGEPMWPGRTAVERPACAQHEALINVLFADRPIRVLCPYDTSTLDPSTIADAWRTHPTMIDDGPPVPSGAYGDPVATAEAVNAPLPRPPAAAARLRYERVPDLAEVRSFVRGHAAGPLCDERARALVLAAHELAANTIRHAGGPGHVTIWTEPGLVACQVEDRGHITDPLAGRRPPPPMSMTGRGLLLVNQMCDLVRIRTGPAGTTVRVHMWAAPAGDRQAAWHGQPR